MPLPYVRTLFAKNPSRIDSITSFSTYIRIGRGSITYKRSWQQVKMLISRWGSVYLKNSKGRSLDQNKWKETKCVRSIALIFHPGINKLWLLLPLLIAEIPIRLPCRTDKVFFQTKSTASLHKRIKSTSNLLDSSETWWLRQKESVWCSKLTKIKNSR